MKVPVVRVALDVPVAEAFDYLAPDAQGQDIGRRVCVPFARGEKIGVIVDVRAQSALPEEKLRPVHEILRDMPPLPADWLDLARFCSAYYHHPLGEVMALALPPLLRKRQALPRQPDGRRFALNDAGRQALAQFPERSVARRLLTALETGGAKTIHQLKEISATAGQKLPEWLAKGWLQEAARASASLAGDGPDLLAGQREALDTVGAAFGQFACFLLHGVTGSGKTEVYLRLVEKTLHAGRQALLLVPEIALTPQLEKRVSTRFPEARLVSLHSHLAEGARAVGFLQALKGEADIILGTRLSVFTPLPRLGLIVVDEEHDPSFKQQEGMRYSARDVAVWRARQRSVPIVLGSATPSLESWAAVQAGRYRLLELRHRALAQAMPSVRCVDIRREKLQEGLSGHLLRAIALRLERGEQSLVFLNRRGYAPVLACPACGWVSRCPACAANLVLHFADGKRAGPPQAFSSPLGGEPSKARFSGGGSCLRCHHCGREERIPIGCPDCGNQDIQPFGRGTQRLEETLGARFPQARILRVDRDNTKSQSRWHGVLETIHRGEADILVGTQMLAKGHDFPQLTLVGVLNADSALFAADFRAPERLFSQLMQVGGRSGRAALPGEVLIQTQYPDHPLYRCLVGHDFAAFAEEQLAQRRSTGLPPFSHQALLRAEAPKLSQSLEFLKAAAELGKTLAVDNIALYDAVPMRLYRLAHLERAQLLVESSSRPLLQGFLDEWLPPIRSIPCPRALRWHIDIDPIEL